MKKIITMILALTLVLVLLGCNKETVKDQPSVIFEAEILEIKDSYFLVEPLEGSQELNSSDQITVPMKNMSLLPELEIGDIVEIEYNGEIAESYPAQIMEVYSIKIVKENENAGETIIYNGQEYKKSELSADTLYWLGLSEQERIASSYLPPEFMKINESNDQLSGKEAFIVTSIMTGETKALLTEDGLSLSDILESDAWNTEGTSDCMSNIEITLNNVIYEYHSDCGTFNDGANQRSLLLDEKTQHIVNTILKKYVPLTAEEVPME